MKNVLLFGSGNGAKNYVEKMKDQINIIGILDNNENKHGQMLFNVPIMSPVDIHTLNYEEIIIVSQWASQIYHQLIHECNIPASKVYIPPKASIKGVVKPFENSNTRALAREIIKTLSFQAQQDGISLVVDFGTLLGLVRDNDVIEWDDDVDFSVIHVPAHINLSQWIIEALHHIHLPIEFTLRSKLIENSLVNFIVSFKNKSLDTPFIYFDTSLSFRKVDGEHSIHLPSGGMWYAPKKHFDSYEVLMWNSSKIMVPCEYKDYLTFLYGNWEVPKKNITMADYAHLGNVGYEEFINSIDGYQELL